MPREPNFGWSYPPGAENDPSAPYNQTDDPSDNDAYTQGYIDGLSELKPIHDKLDKIIDLFKKMGVW